MGDSLTALCRAGLLLVLVFSGAAMAAELRAGPHDYREVVRRLQAGDTLHLAPGLYLHGLDIHRMQGSAPKPIAVRGASPPGRTVFPASAGRNTVSIIDSAHVTISDLHLSGGQVPVDAVKAEGHARYAHHITLERLRIEGYDGSQQNVGVSTKCPAWGWVIRDNTIAGAGTGIYLGNSDGSAPFIRGVIEGNTIVGTLGYAMQIKHQHPWPAAVDVADVSGETMIRYNTFVKDRRSSTGEQARPNLLLGHGPLSGRGAADRYLVYGNLFFDNPAEALLQAEGNLVIYNNVFVNRQGDGVMLREHNDVPRAVEMFGNTILARGVGIRLRSADPAFRQQVDGNAVFSAGVEPVSIIAANLVDSYEAAASALQRPFGSARAPDLAPAARGFDGERELSDARALLPDVRLDFDRKPRGSTTTGAYAAGAPAEDRRFAILDAKPSFPHAPAR
jgi:hypothetical protein